jgi:Uncharacterized protein conserved in bacteria (DUF2200)
MEDDAWRAAGARRCPRAAIWRESSPRSTAIPTGASLGECHWYPHQRIRARTPVLIKRIVCGVRVEHIDDPLMRKIRHLDNLIDELAPGKAMEKILRQ